MSISSEITRISNAKTAIAESIANKGVTVPSGTKIDGMATLIDSIQTGGGGGDTSETWVLNENVDTATQQTFEISFVSNGKTFSKLVIGGRMVPGDLGFVYSLYFGELKVAEAGVFEAGSLYRKVTFAAAPTGGLLTWLEANGVKQASDTAVQPSKALTVTSNGTTTITPDAPYDALKKVDVTVNVPGIEMCSLTIKADGPAMGSPNVWYFDGEKVTQVAAYGTAVQVVKNSMICSGGTLRDPSGVLSNIANPYPSVYIWQIIKSGTVRTM